MSMIQIIKTSISIVAILGLVSCAMLGTDTIEQAVTKRAMLHQQALMENDFEEAYKFLTPGYRKLHSFKDFLATKGSTIKRVSSEIDRIECETDSCSVFMVLYYKYQGIAGFHTKPEDPPVSRINKEKWIKLDGQWWLYRAD